MRSSSAWSRPRSSGRRPSRTAAASSAVRCAATRPRSAAWRLRPSPSSRSVRPTSATRLSALLSFSRNVEAAVPYRIDVTPWQRDDFERRRPGVSALLAGFDAEEAALMVRKGPDAQFERVPMIRGESGAYEGMLFDLACPARLLRRGRRGPLCRSSRLKVVELPYVQRLELEYHFPAYTGLPPQKIEDGGDIAVLRGTEIRVRATPTMATTGGQRRDREGRERSRSRRQADGALAGEFKVDKDGFYHLELNAPAGERVNGVAASTRSTSSATARRRSRSPSPGAIPRRRRSKKCSSKRRPTTTSA